MATVRVYDDEGRLKENVIKVTIPTPEVQDRLEVRFLTLYITWSFCNDLFGPLTYLSNVAPSMLTKVASLSSIPGSVFWMFAASLVLMIPHTIYLLLFPSRLGERLPRKCATAAAALSALAWFYLATLSEPLDFNGSPLAWLYGRQVIDNLWLALIFGISLNNQQLKRLFELFREK